MKGSILPIAVLALALASGDLARARADYVYSNGPIGNRDGYDIHFNPLSDSFTVATASKLTKVQVGLWVDYGVTPATLEWSIGTAPFGSNIGSGLASLTNTFLNSHSFDGGGTYSVFASTFPLNSKVGSGIYWLTLGHARASDGSAVYWDFNNGPSAAFVAFVDKSPPLIGAEFSESFQILGNQTVASPEPSSITVFAIGITSVAGFGWRRRRIAASLV